jgi:hypothetical protein
MNILALKDSSHSERKKKEIGVANRRFESLSDTRTPVADRSRKKLETRTKVGRGIAIFKNFKKGCKDMHITSSSSAINVPTTGAQAFIMDYTQGERAISHHACPVRVGGC